MHLWRPCDQASRLAKTWHASLAMLPPSGRSFPMCQKSAAAAAFHRCRGCHQQLSSCTSCCCCHLPPSQPFPLEIQLAPACMQGLVARWSSEIAAQALGTWLGSSASKCHCTCAGAVDSALLNLIKGQLDRCGPEHLHGAPTPAPSGLPWAVFSVCVGLALCLGFALGVLTEHWRGNALAARRRVPAAPARGESAEGGAGLHPLRAGGGALARAGARSAGRYEVGGGDSDAGRS